MSNPDSHRGVAEHQDPELMLPELKQLLDTVIRNEQHDNMDAVSMQHFICETMPRVLRIVTAQIYGEETCAEVRHDMY